MKILYIAPSNSVHTKRWLDRAAENGVEVFLYDQLIGGGREISSASETFFLKSRTFTNFLPLISHLLNIFRHYLLIKKILKNNNFDLIHGHWLFDVSMLALTFQQKIKLVITPWGSDVQYQPKKSPGRRIKVYINRLIVRRLARKALAICCDSEAQKNILLTLGADKAKIQIIYFGTNTLQYKPENRSLEIRKKYGADDNSVLIISNRSHEEVYDIETFVYASKIAYDLNQNLRFVLAGSGSLTKQYLVLIKKLGLEHIYFLPGRMDDFEFSASTASCDIYVSTSKSDGGLAASTAEAMASGLPVLISDFGENSDWLRKESAGYVFAIGDFETLAKQIIKLSSNKEMRMSMGIAGKRIIEKDNNSRIEWIKVNNLYTSLI
jgi:glycosyltransferase involved in cell wall biosynthesis